MYPIACIYEFESSKKAKQLWLHKFDPLDNIC